MKHIVEEVVLNNGSRGLLIHVPGATVMAHDIEFRAGNYYVRNNDIFETAHIMEHMVLGANKKYPNARAFSAELEKNGAITNATTDGTSIHYIADCADFESERILDLLQLSVTEPIFLPEEFKAEYGNVHEELTGYLNRHGRVLWSKIETVSGERYLTDAERLKVMPNVKLGDVQEHYKRTHSLDNMRFVIAGDLHGNRRQKIIKKLETWRLPRGERFSYVSDELVGAADPIHVVRKDFDSLLYGISIQANWRLPDTERDAMSALNHILTGTLHSRIYGQARAKGLAYNVGSGLARGQNITVWTFGGEVSLSKAKPLFNIIVGELQKVLAGDLSDSEIEAAKSYALGKYQMGCQTVGSIVNWYSYRYYFDGYIDNYDDGPKWIEAVDKDTILKVANELIAGKRWAFGGLGNITEAQLKELHAQLSVLFE